MYQSHFFLQMTQYNFIFINTLVNKISCGSRSCHYIILTSNYCDTVRLKLRSRYFRAHRWSSPFMLRSSFILKIARERARRMHKRDNPDQEMISRKAQIPKTRALEEKRDKARSWGGEGKRKGGKFTYRLVLFSVPKPGGSIVRARTNYGMMRACETLQGPKLCGRRDVTLNRFPPLTNSEPGELNGASRNGEIKECTGDEWRCEWERVVRERLRWREARENAKRTNEITGDGHWSRAAREATALSISVFSQIGPSGYWLP